MHRYTIAQSDSGYEIYVNLIASSAGLYLSRRPYVLSLIKEVLASMDLSGTYLEIEYDMGRTIGNTDILETSDKDVIYYAIPYKNKASVFSRYARNRYPLPSQMLSIIVKQDSAGNYEVINTWIGPCSPPFPGDENATDSSKTYWQTHALAQDFQGIQSKTITKACPY